MPAKAASTPPRGSRPDNLLAAGGFTRQCEGPGVLKAAATAAAAGRLAPKVSVQEKMSGRAKSVRVQVGGNRFLVQQQTSYSLTHLDQSSTGNKPLSGPELYW